MTDEKEKQLVERFDFLRTSGDPMKDLMVFGFACNDGWFQTIWDLCEDLDKMNKERMENIPQDEIAKAILDHGYNPYEFKVVQVKEKFGSLRFYTNGANDKMYKRIREAEDATTEICEDCGQPGEMRHGGWIKCQCDKCFENK